MTENKTQLYLISPESFEFDDFNANLKHAFAGGRIASFQLRLKKADEAFITKCAREFIPLCHDNECAFIMNDYPELAVKVGADGIHVGDEDMPVAKVRKLVGEKLVIGASCYGSRDLAMQAGEDGADYIAFGQFYETATKPPKGRPTPEILEWWSQYTVLPSVAIGGIKAHNLAPLVRAGADFIAVVTAVWNHEKGAKEAVRELNAAIEKAATGA